MPDLASAVRDFVADTDVEHGPVETWNSGGTAGILDQERAKASFIVEKLTNYIDGGEKNTARRRFIMESTSDLDDLGSSSQKYDSERNGKNGSIAKVCVGSTNCHMSLLFIFNVGCAQKQFKHSGSLTNVLWGNGRQD